MSKSKALREERKKIYDQMQATVLKAGEDSRPLTPEEREQFSRMEADCTRLLQEAEGYECIERFNSNQLNDINANKNAGKYAPTQATEANRKLYNKALKGYLGRFDEVRSEFPNAPWQEYASAAETVGYKGNTTLLKYVEAPFDTTVSTKGIETLRLTLADEIYEALLAYGGIFAAAGKFNTSDGGPFRIVTSDNTTVKGALVAQNAADNITELALSDVTLSSYLYSSGIIKIPFECIRDSAYDLQKFISEHAAEAVNRKLSDVFLSGTGSGQPLGILASGGINQGFQTTASATSVSYTDMLELIFSVNRAYRQNGAFLMGDGMRKVLLTLTGSISQPLWEPSVQAGMPDRWMGYPVYFEAGLPTPADNNKPCIFGDIARAYKVRLVGNPVFSTSDQRYFEFRQVAAVYHMSLDATVVDKNAAKYLQMKDV